MLNSKSSVAVTDVCAAIVPIPVVVVKKVTTVE